MPDNKDDGVGYNPMSHSSIDEILKRRKEVEKKLEIREEEIDEYKVVLNRIFSSPDGKYFLKKLVEFSGIHLFDNELNPAKLVEDRGRKSVYLKMIRPFLERSITAEVEN